MQLVGIEQHREDRRGEIAAVAAEHRRQAVRACGDEAGGNRTRLRMRQFPVRKPPRAFLPIDDHPEFAGPHHQHLARIEQGVVAAALAQVRMQQPRGEHFAHALDAFERGAPRLPQQADRAQQLGQLRTLRVDPVAGRGRRFQQRIRGLQMALPQAIERGLPVAALRGGLGEADQGIGGALHRRHHHHLPVFVGIEHQARDVSDAPGIGQRTAAELVRAALPGGRGMFGRFCVVLRGQSVHRGSWAGPRIAAGRGFAPSLSSAGRCTWKGYPGMTDRTGLVPVVMVVMVVRRRDMDRLCCTATKAVKRWLRM